MKVTRHIILCIWWLVSSQMLWSQSSYQVTPLPFNTSYADEVAAVPYDNGLIYCSNRNIHVLINRTDLNNEPLYHLYYVAKRDSAKWGIPRAFSKDLTSNAHQGPSSVSTDGQELYFTVNDRKGNGIFIVHKEGENWTNVRPFTYNSPDYKTAHPSLSRDGKRLFFASDMPGGYGGFDIYYCEWTPTGWGTPKNLGSKVNTSEDELYPFIQANGMLYFSSYAHQSMGGLDIFSTRESTDGTWTIPQRLESPINSKKDDFAYATADTDGLEGYFSSNRNGRTIDIFSFVSLFPVFADCKQQEENDYTYEFFEPGSINLDTTTFRYEWNLGDGTIKRGETVEHTFASTGQYIIHLNVVDTLTGEIDKLAATYYFDVVDIEQPYITTNTTIEAGKPLSLDASKTYLPEVNIEGYYWIFGDGTRTQGEQVEHVFITPGIYQVQLGVIGTSKETGEKVKACSFREVVVTTANNE